METVCPTLGQILYSMPEIRDRCCALLRMMIKLAAWRIHSQWICHFLCLLLLLRLYWKHAQWQETLRLFTTHTFQKETCRSNNKAKQIQKRNKFLKRKNKIKFFTELLHYVLPTRVHSPWTVVRSKEKNRIMWQILQWTQVNQFCASTVSWNRVNTEW